MFSKIYKTEDKKRNGKCKFNCKVNGLNNPKVVTVKLKKQDILRRHILDAVASSESIEKGSTGKRCSMAGQ